MMNHPFVIIKSVHNLNIRISIIYVAMYTYIHNYIHENKKIGQLASYLISLSLCQIPIFAVYKDHTVNIISPNPH